MAEVIAQRNTSCLMNIIDEVMQSGNDPIQLTGELTEIILETSIARKRLPLILAQIASVINVSGRLLFQVKRAIAFFAE
ncbi:MAG: hypothetical protein MZU97_10895 [Bacillus subtilis]|nr:hypothetical protein [Bacillus subtilis]